MPHVARSITHQVIQAVGPVVTTHQPTRHGTEHARCRFWTREMQKTLGSCHAARHSMST